MPNIEKVKVPSAITRRTKLDLSHDHMTTLQFGRPQPVSYRHMLKGEKLDVRCVATVRPFPLAVPTFGRMRLNMRAFFVPYSQIFPQWDSYYTDVIGSDQSHSSLVSSPPLISNDVFVDLFATGQTYAHLLSQPVETIEPQPAFDFVVGGQKFKLKPLGRHYLKILYSLGYRFSWLSKADRTRYNALALLAYAKVFYDWFCNQNYLNSARALKVKRFFEYRNPTTPLLLGHEDLWDILGFCAFVCYDNDPYFNAAWDQPSGPILSQTSMFTFEDITSPNGYEDYVQVKTYQGNGTPYMKQKDNKETLIGTQYIHDVLKMLTDYQKRHQLASALPVSRWLAQWGDSVPSLANSRSIYIGAKSVDINVGDIMSTASTDDAQLGDYAGRSFGQGDGSWSFTCQEFGVFMIITSVLPVGSLYQGVDRHNLSVDKFDFFQPEADGLSVQAIARREVLVPMTAYNTANEGLMNGVFGYTGRYGHYKRSLNFVTGDFIIPSAMAGGSSWHLSRMLEGPMQESFAYGSLGHSERFTWMEDNNMYNRIFNVQERSADYFFGQFHFDISALSPCRPLFDTYQFEDVGNSVTLDNGAFVN